MYNVIISYDSRLFEVAIQMSLVLLVIEINKTIHSFDFLVS